jgi:hypothetical protein
VTRFWGAGFELARYSLNMEFIIEEGYVVVDDEGLELGWE